MKLVVAVIGFVAVLSAGSAVAGQNYDGWGADKNAAMQAAVDSAKKNSRAGCLCKGWDANMSRDCKKDPDGGFICTACGSNHEGSCGTGGSELERLGIKF